MGEKMSLQQVRDAMLEEKAWARGTGWPMAAGTLQRWANAIDAHLTQPAQAVDVGAEDRFEQYVKTLIDKAPDVQRLGERLANWLDDDQFNNIEPILLGIARQLAALPNANGKEGAEWPAGCIKPNSCARHRACMYGRNKEACRHFGRDIGAAIDAAISRKEDTPDAAR